MTPLTYESTRLVEAALPADPLIAFDLWFNFAVEQGLPLPEACAVATASPEGKPSVRMVLYKGREGGDFVFFTNYDSRKSRELEANPQAAIVFHWPTLERQIRIEGSVIRCERAASEAYFATRPRGSQIGAWASDQSAPLPSREWLEERVRQAEQKFAGLDVPCPPHWGGYAVRPTAIEFWQGMASRLHERHLYRYEGGRWTVVKLQP